MKNHVSYALALGLAVMTFVPHSVSAQSQPTTQKQKCVTPSGSDEAAYEEMGISHPKVISRECFPDGSLKIWTKSQDDESHVIEHDASGKLVRDVVVYHDVYVDGWHMVATTTSARGELIEQNWVAPESSSKRVPAKWTLFGVNVYQGKKDTNHPLAVIMYQGNPTPIIVRKARPDGKSDLQRYRTDGTLQYSMQVIGDGQSFENRKDYTSADNVRMPVGTIDPDWAVMPNVKDLPDLQ